MRAIALCVPFLTSAIIFAQTDSLALRVRDTLAGTGHADEAIERLRMRDYPAVDSLLASAPLPNQKARSDVISLRGAIAFLRGDMTAAATDFEAARALAPITDQDAFTEAMAFVSLGDRSRARTVLQGLNGRHPERAIYVYWLGRLDFDERRYEQAAAELQAAVRLDAASARAWDSLGLTFDMEGQAEQARAAFERSAALNREQRKPSPWPPHDLGYWLLRSNRLGEAEAEFRESLTYDPAFPRAHYHLGRTLDKEGRESEAVVEYVTAVKNDPGSADACYSLALLYRKLKRQADASAMFAEYRKRKQAAP